MRTVFALVVAILASAGVHLAAAQLPPKVNGWYPCYPSDALPPNATVPNFECATVEVPLCHAGICQSDKKIDLFVRRLLADPKKKPDVRKALWLLQGGPGGSSKDMDGHVVNVYGLLDANVDVYTMDHRGTGRSFFLDCKAAQAFSAGSPAGVEPDYQELPNCVRDIMYQIGNKTEAFSVTSAAKDMEYLTANLYPSDIHTYIYGVSYGTYFTERIMHLAPKHVRGYILDGVVPEDNPSFTTTTVDRVPPAERLAKACEKDAFCSSKFSKEVKQQGGLHAAWMALYDTLDKAAAGSNKCADVLRKVDPTAPPSYTLRNALGALGPDIGKRVAIPAFYYRARRCNAGDVAFFAGVIGGESPGQSGSTDDAEQQLTPPEPTSFDQVGQFSAFLGGIIKASEMWTVPSPSWEDELKDYKKGLLPSDMFTDFAWYCYLTGSFNDPACTGLKAKYPKIDFSNLNVPKFTYKPDQYWHNFAPIPAQASVLVMNGKLDFQTVSDGGVREYNNLKGDAAQKMMVEFEYGGHGVALGPSTFSDESECGYKIVASFVAVDGKTDKVDTTCLSKLPPIDFKDLSALQELVPTLTKAEELYDADPSAELAKPRNKVAPKDAGEALREHLHHLAHMYKKAMGAAVHSGSNDGNNHHRHHYRHAKVHRAAGKMTVATADADDDVPRTPEDTSSKRSIKVVTADADDDVPRTPEDTSSKRSIKVVTADADDDVPRTPADTSSSKLKRHHLRIKVVTADADDEVSRPATDSDDSE